ncbi:MAG: hypothetical protein M3Q07_08805 [Pseudobdellovibrionaceae bacterium]|nr:hypothetical protein [Pseudobdellovibrionaceae bacterium]
MLFRYLAGITLAFFVQACDTLNNRANVIAVECGLDKASIGQRNFVKLLSSSGIAYENSVAETLKARFRLESGNHVSLSITPRACIELPSDAGILQIVDSRNGESLARKVAPESSARGLISLNLSPKPDFQAHLPCSNEGIFASDTLKNPLFVTLTGEASGLDLRLDVFSHENTFLKTLLHKRMGESEVSFPNIIDVSDIKDGNYYLKIYGHHLSDGIDSRPLHLGSDQLCKFHILRGNIYVGGFDSSSKQLVFPPQTTLPWKTQSSFDKLHVCFEPQTGSSPIGFETSEQCYAQNICIDPLNFKEMTQIVTHDVGIFNYFVYAENKAGKKSKLNCQTVIVSDAPPTLAVTWAHEDLKKPGSILRSPYAVLKADVETQHHLVQSSSINNSLSCKVDFEIKGKSFYSEKSVYCTEGRCKGQSLADYVPCDKRIAFTLVGALNQPMLLNSRLRLTVRSNDGAGHTSEAQASVWINQSTWVKETFRYEIDNVQHGLMKYLIDTSGDIVATFSGPNQYQLATLVSGQWKALKPDDQGILGVNYQLVRAPDRSIQIARIIKSGAKTKVDVYVYKNTQLVQIASPDENPISCSNFQVGPDNTSYCMGSTVNEVFQLIRNNWVQLP